MIDVQDGVAACQKCRRVGEAIEWHEDCRMHSGLSESARLGLENRVDGVMSSLLSAAHYDSTRNPAAHDAWQLALQCLEPLRTAIVRARQAEGKK